MPETKEPHPADDVTTSAPFHDRSMLLLLLSSIAFDHAARLVGMKMRFSSYLVLLQTAHDSLAPDTSAAIRPGVECARLCRAPFAVIQTPSSAHGFAVVGHLAKSVDMFSLAFRIHPHLFPATLSPCFCAAAIVVSSGACGHAS